MPVNINVDFSYNYCWLNFYLDLRITLFDSGDMISPIYIIRLMGYLGVYMWSENYDGSEILVYIFIYYYCFGS